MKLKVKVYCPHCKENSKAFSVFIDGSDVYLICEVCQSRIDIKASYSAEGIEPSKKQTGQSSNSSLSNDGSLYKEDNVLRVDVKLWFLEKNPGTVDSFTGAVKIITEKAVGFEVDGFSELLWFPKGAIDAQLN